MRYGLSSSRFGGAFRLSLPVLIVALIALGAAPASAQSLFLNHSFETPDGAYPLHWEWDPWGDHSSSDLLHVNAPDAADGNWYARIESLESGSNDGYSPADTNYQLQPGARYRLTFSWRRNSEDISGYQMLYQTLSYCYWDGNTVTCLETFYPESLDPYPSVEPVGVWTEKVIEFQTLIPGPDETLTAVLALCAGSSVVDPPGGLFDYDNVRLEFLEWRVTPTPTVPPTVTVTPTITQTPTPTPTPRPVEFALHTIETSLETLPREDVVRVGDIDGDRDLDFVLLVDAEPGLAWFENLRGQPVEFSEHIIPATGSGFLGLGLGDIDRDGDPDVVAQLEREGVYHLAWFENDGGAPPVFTEHPIGDSDPAIWWLEMGDMDSDGDPDIMAYAIFGPLSLYRNNGGSPLTFAKEVVRPPADVLSYVSLNDLNGDGYMDFVTSNADPSRLQWYQNNLPSATDFTERTIYTDPTDDWILGMDAADFNGDGRRDIVSSVMVGYENIQVFLNDGGDPLAFTELPVADNDLPSGEAPYVRATDLDGDGDQDFLATGDMAYRDLYWFRNRGGSPPVFDRIPIIEGSNLLYNVEPADFDNDGDQDILLGVGSITWLEQVGVHFPTSVSRWKVYR